MKPFERSEFPTLTFQGSERLLAFTQSVRDALIPRAGPATSVQGELVRANDRLFDELLRNGFGNYYVEDEPIDANYYGALAIFMLDTLIENRGGALSPDEVARFSLARSRLGADRAQALLERRIEQAEEEPSAEDLARAEANTDRIHWEELLHEASGCIANWCVANPKLVDRRGRAMEVNGTRDVTKLGKREAGPVCPLCQGKGFIPQAKETDFPKRCSCTLAP